MMRLLRGEREPAKGGPRPGRRVYGDDVRAALVVVWEASDRICGKSLHPLLPTLIEAMNEPHRVCRRPFGLSYAAMAGSSSMA